jgi:hypothetical protein
VNNCYHYSMYEGRVLLWSPGQEPSLNFDHRDITGDIYALRELFHQPEPAVFVPCEIVQILSNG